MSIVENCRAHSGSTSFATCYHDFNPHHCRRELNVPRLKMNIGSFYLPKDNAEKPQGEDAHFFSKEKNTIGVADEVSG